ncbi:MAG: TlpA family protein disulfide reductase [Candidatus Scatovivens sp.]
MSKKNIFILIFSILFFLFALAFLLYTFSINDTNKNNTVNYSNGILDNSVSETTNNANTANSSDTSDTSISEDLPDIEYESLIDFTFYNKNNEEFNLSRYKDKPIAILFSDFSGSYEICVEYLSLLNSYYEKYKSNIQFLCIDKSNFIDSDSNIEIYKDKDGIEKYSIDKLPSLIFINKEGEIINQVTSITLDSLEANLDLITGNF